MKMWDGRFSGETDSLMERFNNSLPVDAALIEEDITGSIAWAKALRGCGVLSADEVEMVVAALEGIRRDYARGSVQFLSCDEDIHMAVERLLIDRAGEAGAAIHTGRSRNDQVVCDLRLFVKKHLRLIHGKVSALQKALLTRASREQDVVVPGYTHLQQAQPITLSHYWLSLLWGLQREKTRLHQARECADILVLGSGALAGSGFAVDRDALAAELGFGRVSENSIDAVSSRDFVLQSLGAIASLGTLLSRYAEDLIVWSSREFGFVELDDAWSTGSSMMPQKKNPDSLELIRGKSGRFVGNYTRLCTTLKGVGLTYFKDLQEDKEPLLDSIGQIAMVLEVYLKVIQTLKINPERMRRQCDPLLLATDLADYLVQRGVAFRDAHRIVGRLVGHVVETGQSLDRLPLAEFRKFSDRFDESVKGVLDWSRALAHRDIAGGTGPRSVRAQIERARAMLEQD